jgi:tetratricopeptide (TPR) repeat protein
MSQERLRELTEQGLALIGEGKFEEALQAAIEASALAPADAEPQIQRGIALSSLGRAAEADDAFKRALTLSPYSAKAHFNYAVHRFHQDDLEAARRLAEEAVQLDPNHASARELASQLGASAPTPSKPQELPAMAPYVPEPQAAPTVAPAPGQTHLVDFIGKLGEGWSFIGWGLSILNFAAMSGYVRLVSKYQPKDMAGFDSSVAKMAQDGMTSVVILALLASWGLIVIYTVLDIVDRRGSWLWVLPIGLCSCFIGWMMLPLYLLANRLTGPRR